MKTVQLQWGRFIPMLRQDRLYRIYADAYEGITSPGNPDKVVINSTDGTALPDGIDTERITFQLADSTGTPVSAVRTFSVSLDFSGVIDAVSTGSTNTSPTATMVTDEKRICMDRYKRRISRYCYSHSNMDCCRLFFS